MSPVDREDNTFLIEDSGVIEGTFCLHLWVFERLVTAARFPSTPTRGFLRWEPHFDGMSGNIFETVYVPIADPEDAEATARAVQRYAHEDSTVVVTHVVEKGEGVPDKASVEQREQYASEAYETFQEVLPEGWGDVQFVTLYGRDVAQTIIDGATEADATVIAFTPRGGSRWVRLVTGDVARNLIENSDIPVISLPEPPTRIVLE